MAWHVDRGWLHAGTKGGRAVVHFGRAALFAVDRGRGVAGERRLTGVEGAFKERRVAVVHPSSRTEEDVI
jgi:hypothetical protein